MIVNAPERRCDKLGRRGGMRGSRTIRLTLVRAWPHALGASSGAYLATLKNADRAVCRTCRWLPRCAGTEAAPFADVHHGCRGGPGRLSLGKSPLTPRGANPTR